MNDLRKAAEMALDVLENHTAIKHPQQIQYRDDAIEALRQALTQPEQEPVVWGMQRKDGVIIDVICPEEHSREPGDYTIPLYTAPPKRERSEQREWVGLADEQRHEFVRNYGGDVISKLALVKAIESKLKENNT